MCGILGIYMWNKKKEETDFCMELMKGLWHRGHHAAGICWWDRNAREYKIVRQIEVELDKLTGEFFRSNSYRAIYHNRYSTSGDWQVLENNQPILVKGLGAVAMNGVVSMRTKQEFEQEFDVKCDCDNDAEIILRKVQQGVSMSDFLKSVPRASYAGVHLIGDKITSIRNNKRPLYCYETSNAKYMVSSLDAIIRAGGTSKSAHMVAPLEEVYL